MVCLCAITMCVTFMVNSPAAVAMSAAWVTGRNDNIQS